MDLFNDKIKTYLYPFLPTALRCVITILSHPLDVSKTRLQNHVFINNNNRFVNVNQSRLNWLKTDLTNYGILGLYRGYSITLLSTFFKSYKYLLLIFGPHKMASYFNKSFNHNPILYQMSMIPIIVLTDTIMLGPFRRIKFITMNSTLTPKLSLKAIKNNHNIFNVIINIYLQNGFMGFWYGSKAYAIKHSFGSSSLIMSDALIRSNFYCHDLPFYHPKYVLLHSINGVFLTLISTPFDVITTNMTSKLDNTPNKGYYQTIKSIYRQEGIHGFSKGFSIRLFNRTASSLYTSLVISWGRETFFNHKNK